MSNDLAATCASLSLSAGALIDIGSSCIAVETTESFDAAEKRIAAKHDN